MRTLPALCVAAACLCIPAQGQVIISAYYYASITDLDFHPKIRQIDINTYTTEITGTLNGGTLFDQSYQAPFGDAAVQQGLLDARAAITATGGPGVVIATARLVSHSESSDTSVQTIYSEGSGRDQAMNRFHSYMWEEIELIRGPVTLQVGALRNCAAAIASLPTTTFPECVEVANPRTVDVPAGVRVQYTTSYGFYPVDATRVTTATTHISEVYELAGTIEDIATVHSLAVTAAGQRAREFQYRLLDRIGAPPTPGIQPAADSLGDFAVWGEGFHFSADQGRDGDTDRYRGEGNGFALGLSYAPIRALSIGLAVEKLRHDIDTRPGEGGRLDITEIGLGAALRQGPLSLVLAGAIGSGEQASRHDGGAEVTPHVTIVSASAKAGYETSVAGIRLVPEALFAYSRSERGPFQESGGLALAVPRLAVERSEAGAGLRMLAAGRPFGVDLSFAEYIRGSWLISDPKDVTVTFVSAPNVPLLIRGIDEARFGIDLGAGIAAALSRDLSLSLAYDGTIRGRFAYHAFSAGLRLAI